MRIGKLEFGITRKADGSASWEWPSKDICHNGCSMFSAGPFYLTWLRGACVWYTEE